jgi:uncharacterized Ntn-hydrolase superfamily protein
LADLLAADSNRDLRQVGIVDAHGRAAAWTGPRCVAAAGHFVGDGFAVQANMMACEKVWPAMAQAYTSATGDLAARLLAALDAAEEAGGDARGRQSAARVIVAAEFAESPWTGRVFDLRIDDHSDPLVELHRLVELQRAYNHMNAGDAAMEKNDTEAATVQYATAERLNPASAETVFWHAVAIANGGRPDKSIPLFRRCFQMDARWKVMLPRIIAAGLLKNPPVASAFADQE